MRTGAGREEIEKLVSRLDFAVDTYENTVSDVRNLAGILGMETCREENLDRMADEAEEMARRLSELLARMSGYAKDTLEECCQAERNKAFDSARPAPPAGDGAGMYDGLAKEHMDSLGDLLEHPAVPDEAKHNIRQWMERAHTVANVSELMNNPNVPDGAKKSMNQWLGETGGAAGADDNTQETGVPVLGSAGYNSKILDMAKEKGAREAFSQIMADAGKYGSQLDDFTSGTVAGFNSLVVSLIVQIGADNIDEKIHYFRVQLNRAPKSLDEMIKFNRGKPEAEGWKLFWPLQAMYHMHGRDGEYNLKFVSPDGHFEAVYNKNGELLTAENGPVNMGTYNYFGPENQTAHTNYDVNPYYKWGNTHPSQTEGFWAENIKGLANYIRFIDNEEAYDRWWEYLRQANPGEYKRQCPYEGFSDEVFA